MKKLISRGLKQSQLLVNWLIPDNCLVCQNNKCLPGQCYCKSCDINSHYRASYCQACGQAFSSQLDHCGRCLTEAPAFDACICPFNFNGSIRELIWRFKYQQQPYLAKPLAKLFCNELGLFSDSASGSNSNSTKDSINDTTNDYGGIINLSDSLPEAIIAVPSHSIALRQRGYNQSNLLAIEIAKLLNIPVFTDMLSKVKHTKSQVQLGLKQRKSNLKNSFEVVKSLQLQHLAIVDDVITTNATMSEISKILKKNGVDYVQAWGIAHTS